MADQLRPDLRSDMPLFPGLVRPIVRSVFFNRMLKRQSFPRARTNVAPDPATGPPTPVEGRVARFRSVARS